MKRFHQIDDGAVILRSKGVYRQAKLFRRDDTLYAGYGGGFIKLYPGGGTSVPSVSYVDDGIDGAAGQVIEDRSTLSVKWFAMGNAQEAAE